ncbi:hypothetical protein [Bifidobacterium sp. ESL0764]|uniref:hypothetical protein n=1 Tax=Bifidobacterium sp. ESL0764 TaxID=2983228 RepID=UPI0023F92205|nr:hypothetical protein [Bifidobacterium sp. ESL0764]WEV66019.1 hypothetical protein OZX71_01290 [Bifidobacterium sp. ESL0764]
MSKSVSIFNDAATMEIPDDFECGSPQKTSFRQRGDIGQLKNKLRIWRSLLHATRIVSSRMYFYNPNKPDTRIVCSDAANTAWPSDLAQATKSLEKAVYTTYKNPTDVKTTIRHDKNGEPLLAMAYSLTIETGIWYVLLITLPIRGHMNGITMKCTAEDAEIRWSQFMAAADSITILKP